MSLQEALKLMRMELGLTQNDLAEKLNKAFITVNRWENGKGFPSRSNARAIIEIAEKGHASKDCIGYLNEVLLPDLKRALPATSYGFPDIDREFLFQLADGSTNAIYVIEAGTYRLLYTNRKAENQAVKYMNDMGITIEDRLLAEQADKRCFHYFGNVSEPCPFCPIKQFDSNSFKDVTIRLPNTGRLIHVHAKADEMKGRKVYICYLTDITHEDEERNEMYSIMNDIPDGVGIYHVYSDDRIELAFMNNVLFNMIGEERGKEMMKNGPSSICLVHTKDKPLLWEEIHNSIKEHRKTSIDMRMRLNGGKYKKVHLEGKMLNKANERYTFYCVFKEIED